MKSGDTHRLTIGLTGGIASGKSAVGAAFEALGVTVVDADLLARDAVRPGQPALDEIREAFGDGVFDAEGALDRRRLRERVFEEDAARKRLEAIVHPHVRRALLAARDRAGSEYAILMIPLLVESRLERMVDRVLVVDVPESVQIERLRARDAIDAALAQRMLSAQATREARLARADDVLTNTRSLEALSRRVEQLHQAYLRLARGEVDTLAPQHLPPHGE